MKVIAGENRNLGTNMRAFPGEQKLLPTPISSGVGTDNIHSPATTNILLPGQSQGGPDPAFPHFLIAFPPPLISFGFSPLIKLLAC